MHNASQHGAATTQITAGLTFGMLSFAGIFLLVSCGQGGASAGAEIAACETDIQGALRSPSTYKRISVAQNDRSIAIAEYSAYKVPAPASGDKPAVRTVSITYDAANAFGTPIRGNQQCEFLLRNGASNEFANQPSFSVAIAGADRAMGKSKACCLPELTGEAAAALSNMVADTNMMMDDLTGNMIADSNMIMKVQ